MSSPVDIDIQLGRDPRTLVKVAKTPHILVAGMTGAGKSVAVHHILTQLIVHDPRWVNVALVDPKHVEFSRYAGIPHLGWPWIAYSQQEAEQLLAHFAITEMGMRFHKMKKHGVRDIGQMSRPWARTVIFIDELANLILRSKRLERYIVDIASMGRACGIHLVVATQSPRADVVTGLIRANVPTRVALPTITASESRIILDVGGAEQLTPPGEMLVRLPGQRELVKTKGVYVSDEEIDAVIAQARSMKT